MEQEVDQERMEDQRRRRLLRRLTMPKKHAAPESKNHKTPTAPSRDILPRSRICLILTRLPLFRKTISTLSPVT